MLRRILQSFGPALMLAALVTPGAFGAKSAPPRPLETARVAKSAHNVLPIDETSPTTADYSGERQSLGRAQTTSLSPGKLIGDTWYDLQQNGSMGRMIDWGSDDTNQVLVHFNWMRKSTYPSSGRNVVYNCYYSVQDTLLGQTNVNASGGFSNLDAAMDNRAVIAAHSGNTSCVYWDFAPGFGFFGEHSCVPDTVGTAIWPKMRYQDIPGQMPVTHVFAQVSEQGAGDAQAIHYYRKVGALSTGVWDYPPYAVDTVFDIAQDVACSNIDGKVALVWVANLPDPGDCDTCSSQSGWPFSQWDNDLYYQVSYDYGATFAPRVNVTKNVDGVEGHRPYTDLSTLIGSDNDLRIGWNGRYWPADANSGGEAGQLRCRMLYWGENLGAGGFDMSGDAIIRTAANLEWDQEYCNGGAWQLNGSKMTISECDGKLYYLWVQFNDVPNGIEDDCHDRALSGTDVVGAANGELYLAVSDNGGYTWDSPRNLSNTYSPGCDSATGVGGRCQSEHFPSMSPFGTAMPFPGSGFVVVDPSEGYTGDYFLDVQYIDDPDPGVVLQDEGTWQLCDVRWFRLPCVEPASSACVTPSALYLYDNTSHGQQTQLPLVVENTCNTDAGFTLTVVESDGPEGWLTTSGFESGFLAGGGGRLEGTVTMNTGGIVNDPGTYVQLQGGLLFEGNFVGSPLEIGVSCDVIPEIWDSWPDTISTSCLSLAVLANGNYGHQGMGKVNMDFFNSGDCDNAEPGTEGDTIPGDATIYLYDGSPVICWPDSDSVICNWSIFGASPLDPHGFLPMSGEEVADSGDYEYYKSAFITRDSGIGIQQEWFAPKDQPDSCQFLIHRLRVVSNDGAVHTGLNIGEVIDWDIPADTATRNISGFNTARRLVYQQGSEYNQDAEECQENSDRYGGISLIQTFDIEGGMTFPSTDFYGAYTEDNATWIYPAGGLVPAELDSLMGYNEGYVMEWDSINVDLHSVMTYRYGYTLGPADTVEIISVLATSRAGYANFIAAVEAGHQWTWDHILPVIPCCVGMRGNIDGSPDDNIDISDLVYMVDYMFTGGPEPPCFEEADVTGDGEITIEDLICMVDGMFLGLGWECIAECPEVE